MAEKNFFGVNNALPTPYNYSSFAHAIGSLDNHVGHHCPRPFKLHQHEQR
jgi:hypothetical protein